MKIADQLRCLFSTPVEETDESYVVEVPETEIQFGDIQPGETYRVAILSSLSTGPTEHVGTAPEQETDTPEPPVEEGERRDVEIENIGDQGDGITRVERGFVVIVPDTNQGERVTIEISEVRESVAFAEVVERLSYFD